MEADERSHVKGTGIGKGREIQTFEQIISPKWWLRKCDSLD